MFDGRVGDSTPLADSTGSPADASLGDRLAVNGDLATGGRVVFGGMWASRSRDCEVMRSSGRTPSTWRALARAREGFAFGGLARGGVMGRSAVEMTQLIDTYCP